MEDRIKKDIYKLSYINNTTIDGDQIPTKIIVFYGRTNPVTKQNWEISPEILKDRFALYIEQRIRPFEQGEPVDEPSDVERDNDNEYFNDIFSNTEIENIHTYRINVEFSFDRLYGDDTIETLKKKIIVHLTMEMLLLIS